ncbi:hypothetical protein DFJ58DRAFT_845136 [Suillus subalutaceus]|uniref:uncharacterized protein n=1 Tax=Suillus subalutaceus TaxID=48586 RepID=UPI001B869088|nr:uncharacterized protein DFJ58DRAFT_848059 [Suillus subalutaceus]XP_041239394.1 uncharacterized protein DFJ58DRAFT_845136 [Suillus subalutaceus]KAG1832316.1 hypothetical protein DFJ58DRAFT_848059 [Suillus subalutaceus]KAG1841150.1 hypothetical protein DFJ58DRAFT_845136 [Suillus subalutaceus]
MLENKTVLTKYLAKRELGYIIMLENKTEVSTRDGTTIDERKYRMVQKSRSTGQYGADGDQDNKIIMAEHNTESQSIAPLTVDVNKLVHTGQHKQIVCKYPSQSIKQNHLPRISTSKAGPHHYVTVIQTTLAIIWLYVCLIGTPGAIIILNLRTLAIIE